MASRKETVLKAFRLETPERVPVVIYGGGVWTMANSGHKFEDFIGKPAEYAKLIIDTASKLDSDMVFPGSGYNNLQAGALGGKIKFRPVGAPDLEAPIVDSLEDLERLDFNRLGQDPMIQTIWQATEMVAKEIGDEYLLAPTAWGPFSLAAQFYGVERMMHGMFKQKKLVHAVLEFTTELIFRFYQPMIENGSIQCLGLADATASGDLISRRQFVEFASPYLKKLSDRARSAGALTFLHICGDTNDRLDVFPDTGADLIAIDHKTGMANCKQLIGHKMCVAGNVNPVFVLNQATPDEVRSAAQANIDEAAAGGGYVLLPGCDIPPSVPMENIRAFVATAHSAKYQ